MLEDSYLDKSLDETGERRSKQSFTLKKDLEITIQPLPAGIKE